MLHIYLVILVNTGCFSGLFVPQLLFRFSGYKYRVDRLK